MAQELTVFELMEEAYDGLCGSARFCDNLEEPPVFLNTALPAAYVTFTLAGKKFKMSIEEVL